MNDAPPSRQNLHVRATAAQYDAYTATAVEPWDDLLIRRLFSEKERRPAGGRLVDIGAGTGVVIIKLGMLEDAADLELIATDYFEDMLSVAGERVAKAELSARVRIDRQDVHALSYPGEYARYVISRSTLHHWADPVQAVREIHRVLEPGGVALVHDVRRDAPPNIVRKLNERRRQVAIGPMVLQEKFTADEVVRICPEAGIAEEARIHSTDSARAHLASSCRSRSALQVISRDEARNSRRRPRCSLPTPLRGNSWARNRRVGTFDQAMRRASSSRSSARGLVASKELPTRKAIKRSP